MIQRSNRQKGKTIELDINLFPMSSIPSTEDIIIGEKLIDINLFPCNQIPIKNNTDFKLFNKHIKKNYGVDFPAELEKGFNKYNDLLEKHKNKKNPEISIKREIDRILKRKKITKIDYKKIEIKFNE